MSTGNNAMAAGILKFGEHINKQIAQHNAVASQVHAIALNHHLGALRDQQAHEHNIQAMAVQHEHNTQLETTKGNIAANLEAQKHKQTMAQNRQLSKIQFNAAEQSHSNTLAAGEQQHRQTMSKTRAVAKLAEPGSAVQVEGVGKFNTALPATPARTPRNRAK